MDDLTLKWKDRFERVWDPAGEGRYRMGSPGQRLAPRFLGYVPMGASINEYGSGTGRPVVRIKQIRPDVSVNMVDLASNALEEEARNLVYGGESRVTFIEACLWNLPGDFPIADWGYCVDVLMCVPPEKLDAILRNIRMTCRSLFTQVYDWPDKRLGINYTTIMEGPEWWEAKFRQFWTCVERIKSLEHPRRYIYVCRGGAQ